MRRSFDLFASCLPGLEPLLVQELEHLGAKPRPIGGGATFSGDLAFVMRSCHWLGTASHVLMRLAEFPCRALGELQRKAAQLPWREWLRPQVPVDVHATARASRVYHTGAVVERVENAISEALGARISAPAGNDDDAARVHVRFHRDVCTISIDATPTPLHRRGYRLESAKAPLREDIAHALVLTSGWRPPAALLDPFCGAGTIAIEAAGLGLGLAPGRLRAPALHHLALFDADAWATAMVPGQSPAGPLRINASDRDDGAVKAALHNAERAGVASTITFTTCALAAQPWLADPASAPTHGCIVTNPPFGKRVPRAQDIATLYQTLGHRVARLGADWRLTVLAHDVRTARRTGVPLRAAFNTRHGGLSVTAMSSAAANP